MNYFSKVCLLRKESCGIVYLVEEVKVEDYDLEEFILKIEEIFLIKGYGK